jgi:hypothetical protein
MEVNLGDYNENQRQLRYFQTFAAVDPNAYDVNPDRYVHPTDLTGLPTLRIVQGGLPVMGYDRLEVDDLVDQVDGANRQPGPFLAVNNPGMMWVDVRNSNLDFDNVEVHRIALNKCGQWVKEDDPRIICGNTGWYRPYTFTEAKVMQIYKKSLYTDPTQNVPKPGCHMPGPNCVRENTRSVLADSCGRRPRAFTPRRLNCSTGRCF